MRGKGAHGFTLHGGDAHEEAANAQLGQHHHPRVVHPPLKTGVEGSALLFERARPPDLADV